MWPGTYLNFTHLFSSLSLHWGKSLLFYLWVSLHCARAPPGQCDGAGHAEEMCSFVKPVINKNQDGFTFTGVPASLG